MNTVACMPIWHIVAMIAIVVMIVAPAVGIPSAIYAARYGARSAVELCAKNWECPMQKDAVRQTWQANLKRQHEELLREHPDTLARRRAAEDVERSETPAVGRTRAREDDDIVGHKG